MLAVGQWSVAWNNLNAWNPVIMRNGSSMYNIYSLLEGSAYCIYYLCILLMHS